MVVWLAVKQSPNVDEPAHLAAGMAMWQYGSFENYCVNPPLMRAVATLPILLMPHEKLWADFDGAPQPRPEFVLGAQFVESHPENWRHFLIAARCALLPFSILGGLFCFFWAHEMFGRVAGLTALSLWCFSPNILTWSSLICTDTIAASMGIGAAYFFWRWLQCPNWNRATVVGVFLGLALLSKMTWIILFVLWPLLWGLWRMMSLHRVPAKPQLLQLATILIIGLYTLNFGYAFDGTFTRLGDYEFHSQFLAGESQSDSTSTGNRFAGSLLEFFPVPLPKQYLLGMDLQKVDFENSNQSKPSYLFGKWSKRGWWYYYFVGLVLKVPLGTWGLGLCAALVCFFSWRKNFRLATLSANCKNEHHNCRSARDQIVLVVTGVALLIFVSSQNGFSHHFRYILPAFPFAFVWISQSACQKSIEKVSLSVLVLIFWGWSVISSVSVFPHSMSYFNELAGGPENGHHFMLGSSFSWSQDHFYLKKWIEEHPEIDSPYMQLERSVSLEALGIRSRGTPPKVKSGQWRKDRFESQMLGPIPGWHVISVQKIHEPEGGYLYFLDFKPVAKAGHSIYIFHIDLDGANRVRKALGLAELSDWQISPEQLLDDMVVARESSRLLKVALFASNETEATSQASIQTALASNSELSLTLVSEKEICNGELQEYNVLIVPGGKASVQGTALGTEGRNAVRNFVHGGGGYVGVCAGAFLPAVNHEWSLKLINARTTSGVRYVPGYGTVSASFRGWGAVSVELTDNGRRLFECPQLRHQLDYTGGPVFSRANVPNLYDYTPLAYFRSEVWKYPFQKGTMVDTPAIVATRFGRGNIILFSAHPETIAGSENLLPFAIRACSSVKSQAVQSYGHGNTDRRSP